MNTEIQTHTQFPLKRFMWISYLFMKEILDSLCAMNKRNQLELHC